MRLLSMLAMVALMFAAMANAQVDDGAAGVGKFPHVVVDAKAKQVRVECEALDVEAPLEFFCCVKGTNEHEAVLRTAARPSDIHTGLLMLGLKAGEPVRYSESTKKWSPPNGPGVHIDVEYEKEGKVVRVPAQRWMRNTKTKKEMPLAAWVFTGSRVMEDGKYAADVTGYVVSVVNFDLTLIDVPQLASSANETLEWERNKETAPPKGTKVTMILTPAGDVKAAAPTTRASAMESGSVEELKKKWEKEVGPEAKSIRAAAEAHARIVSALRREQQKHIDEADRIGRAIDELEREYQNLTTPGTQR